jgi:putative FmdB family regulatory protein
MPIYEYQCQKCGTFEVTQRITEKSLSKCPTCKNKVKKLISNTSFQLKGTGWYVTDYARKGQNGDTKTDKAANSSSDSSKESKETKETKTETKTESKKSESTPSSGEKSSSAASSTSA